MLSITGDSKVFKSIQKYFKITNISVRIFNKSIQKMNLFKYMFMPCERCIATKKYSTRKLRTIDIFCTDDCDDSCFSINAALYLIMRHSASHLQNLIDANIEKIKDLPLHNPKREWYKALITKYNKCLKNVHIQDLYIARLRAID